MKKTLVQGSFASESGSQRADLRFLPNGYHVVRPGTFVLCARSGKEIPLHALRYWNVELQEAYAGPREALARYLELRAWNGPTTGF